jgi:hypothetical protein
MKSPIIFSFVISVEHSSQPIQFYIFIFPPHHALAFNFKSAMFQILFFKLEVAILVYEFSQSPICPFW